MEVKVQLADLNALRAENEELRAKNEELRANNERMDAEARSILTQWREFKADVVQCIEQRDALIADNAELQLQLYTVCGENEVLRTENANLRIIAMINKHYGQGATT